MNNYKLLCYATILTTVDRMTVSHPEVPWQPLFTNILIRSILEYCRNSELSERRHAVSSSSSSHHRHHRANGKRPNHHHHCLFREKLTEHRALLQQCPD